MDPTRNRPSGEDPGGGLAEANRPAPRSTPLKTATAETTPLEFPVPDAHRMSKLDMELSMATNVHLTPGLVSQFHFCFNGASSSRTNGVECI